MSNCAQPQKILILPTVTNTMEKYKFLILPRITSATGKKQRRMECIGVKRDMSKIFDKNLVELPYRHPCCFRFCEKLRSDH